MIIATRILALRQSSGERPVSITIHAPIEGDRCWECRFEIGWPEGTRGVTVRGFDGVQALYLGMERIALELYGSPHHHSGDLYWGKPGQGYGFRIPKAGREDLVGEDRVAQL